MFGEKVVQAVADEPVRTEAAEAVAGSGSRPEKAKKNLHAGHRARMWSRMMRDSKNSLESYQDHELLEMLLYFVYTRENTNPLAHQLIETFGSLYSVMNAPYTGLIEVDRIGEKGARLIRLCREIGVRCQKAEVAFPAAPRITDFADAVQYFRPKFVGLQQETVIVAFLGNGGRILGHVVFPPGQVNGTNLDMREIVQRAINLNAAAVILAHNHPSGRAYPSNADYAATTKLLQLLSSIRIALFDHIVLGGGGEAFSMRESGGLTQPS